jgi:hypothetical protein
MAPSIQKSPLLHQFPSEMARMASEGAWIIDVRAAQRLVHTYLTCIWLLTRICKQVYRHPSCLIKHRWEHTPHWREASKFVLSKHQQVQLLEVFGSPGTGDLNNISNTILIRQQPSSHISHIPPRPPFRMTDLFGRRSSLEVLFLAQTTAPILPIRIQQATP